MIWYDSRLSKKEVFMKKLLLICLLFAASGFAYPAIRTGIYDLSGGNSKWGGSSYHGEVAIYPQGENFRVEWRIGASQSQVGIGIVDNDVLSVAYCDSVSGAWGVVSFKIVGYGELHGRWAAIDSTSQKPEYLVWKGY
jgi:hypothetical protein